MNVLDFRFDIVFRYADLLGQGVLLTVAVSIASIILGSLLGFIISLGKMSRLRILNWPASAYINFFRGTPLLVQIFLVHFALIPAVIGKTDGLTAAITALSLNAAAYTAEIFRAGIQSIDRGQTEAALSVGLTRFQAMRFIILPQAVRRMIPAFGNEFITLVKDSSLLAVIAVPELMYWSKQMAAEYYRVWEPYLTAAIVYFILTYLLSKLLSMFERKVR